MIDHYRTLDLPTPRESRACLTAEDIKQAYRLALLKHHPDKQGPAQATKDKPSIDTIKAAYGVLSDAKLRTDYDRELLLSNDPSAKEKSFHTGEEVVDLDDLEFDEKLGSWYRGCRCGEDRGYVVTEQHLENEEQRGGREVVVGCKGCSLWIIVGFSSVEEDEVDERNGSQKA
ncbi:uncharacterized protein PV09_05426 [Verruconis gallopava]|uniref:Diphthamide biosynthesis protein 4 n=1 Tax=Verruconis gallopava TaxID=253628 RepID=A0A0D2A9D2_9PEZI|nr:uncharacterized protein PV09_05426 [Verruconis gallopava]KIW03200.1 hypothetical protein PV09_05426 [Verruconis gallopava]